MSIASSRRGRPNNRRDSDADLAWNTVRVAGQFRCEIYASLGELPSGVFEILVDCLSSLDVGEFIELDDTLSIPDDTTIERGPIPVFKYQLFKNRTAMLGDGYVVLDDDAPVLDLNHARTATESEIRDALDYEPEPIKPTAPVVPTYKRIPRKEGDSASYLGFSVGTGEEKIKLAKGTTIYGIHLASPQVVGRLRASLDFRPLESDRLSLAIYDAHGAECLRAEMASPEVRFDQVRLPAGDLLLTLKGSSALAGVGTYDPPNAAILPRLPERPLLNDLLWLESNEMEPGVRIGVPRFNFSAR